MKVSLFLLLAALPEVVPAGPSQHRRGAAVLAFAGDQRCGVTLAGGGGGGLATRTTTTASMASWGAGAGGAHGRGRGVAGRGRGLCGVGRAPGRGAVRMNLGGSPFGEGFLGVGPAEVVVICVVGYFLLGPTEVNCGFFFPPSASNACLIYFSLSFISLLSRFPQLYRLAKEAGKLFNQLKQTATEVSRHPDSAKNCNTATFINHGRLSSKLKVAYPIYGSSHVSPSIVSPYDCRCRPRRLSRRRWTASWLQ